ncbi:MAG TPA: ABC transporter permease, partial [Thermoanaerobaculia bacterium]|nr:ABC transporter permease [Thermoanaerobaculia bacterium]
MTDLLHELRVTLRRLARAPGFTAVVVLTLALGVGVTTAVFSVAHGVVLSPLPFADPGELVRVWNHPEGNPATSFEASHVDFETWSEASRSFSGVAGHASSSGGHLVDFGVATRERVGGGMVSWNLFEVLGATPVAGRRLSAADDLPGAEPVVAISERLWRHRLGADPQVVGRRIEVDGVQRTVVSVMPADFEYPPGAELWLPVASALPEALIDNPQVKFFNLVARLGDGVSPAAAEEELNAVLDATTNPQVPESARTEVTLSPLSEELLGDTRGPLLFLLGAALLVLALATANVANLELVRAIAARRETAVRAALGAGLWHRVRGSLTESAVLAVAGGALGWGLAWLAVHRLLPLFPATFFRGAQVEL